VVFQLPEEETPVVDYVVIDGLFGDWANNPAWMDGPSDQLENRHINILEYRTNYSQRRNILSFYIRFDQAPFMGPDANSNADDAGTIIVGIDADHNENTGFSMRGVGVDAMIIIDGSDGRITSTTARIFDPDAGDDWSMTTGNLIPKSALAGNEIEVQIPVGGLGWNLGAPHRVIIQSMDVAMRTDYSDTAFSLGNSAITAIQKSALTSTSFATGPVNGIMAVEMESFGRETTISSLVVRPAEGSTVGIGNQVSMTAFSDQALTSSISSPTNLGQEATIQITGSPTISTGSKTTIYLGATVQAGTLAGSTIGLELASIGTTADSYVIDRQQTPRAYVGAAPGYIQIDGLFGDWEGINKQTDNQLDTTDADINLVRFSSVVDNLAPTPQLAFYAEVQGEMLRGVDTLAFPSVQPPEPTLAIVGSPTVFADRNELVVTWSTNKPAGWNLLHITGRDPIEATDGTSHVAIVTGLNPGQNYNMYFVSAVDSSGREQVQSAQFSAQTLSAADTIEFSAIPRATVTSSTSATISWTTNRRSTAVLEYGGTTAYGTSVEIEEGNWVHRVSLTNLNPGSLYHYRITIRDMDETPYTSGDFVFTTRATDPEPVHIPNLAADTLYIFLDTTPGIGYAIPGMPGFRANYMFKALGRYNTVLDTTLWRFSGAAPNVFEWTPHTGTYNAMSSDSELEAAISISSLVMSGTPNVYFHMQKHRATELFGGSNEDGADVAIPANYGGSTRSATRSLAYVPMDVLTSDVSEFGFTVSWITEANTLGSIVWWTDSDPTATQTSDLRGAVSDDTHICKAKALTSATRYYYVINSNGVIYDNGGAPYEVVTMPNVVVSDITSSSFRVTWTTKEVTTGTLDYGTSTPLPFNAPDIRGAVSGTVHIVEVTGLSPGTVYYFRPVSPGYEGILGSVRTHGNEDFPPASHSIHGTVPTFGWPWLVYASVGGYGPIATVTDGSGSFSLNLGNLRNSTGHGYVPTTSDQIDLEIRGMWEWHQATTSVDTAMTPQNIGSFPISARTTHTITGTVQIEGGAAATGALVYATVDGYGPLSAITDGSG
ncbi:MAG: fibronectin type III domain-containing protein, partial [Candidatus Thermoplasmatota archaeon]|nr:fibronectin type III domain-containing protein [Candidatus Thermoplasmatota archaeon]